MIDFNFGALFLGGLLVFFAAGVTWVTSELVMPRRYCPRCDAPFAKLYLPKSWRQWLQGGKTCKKCGCEVDRVGREI